MFKGSEEFVVVGAIGTVKPNTGSGDDVEDVVSSDLIAVEGSQAMEGVQEHGQNEQSLLSVLPAPLETAEDDFSYTDVFRWKVTKERVEMCKTNKNSVESGIICLEKIHGYGKRAQMSIDPLNLLADLRVK